MTTMIMKMKTTNELASAACLPASVVVPATRLTSSRYPTPAARSTRSLKTDSAKAASPRNSAREATLPTMSPFRQWLNPSPENPSRSSTRRWPRRRPTGRELPCSSFPARSSQLTVLPPFSVPRVGNSSVDIGKHSHSVFASRSSARRGGLDASSVLDTDDTPPSPLTDQGPR